jgi:hypothetical protein
VRIRTASGRELDSGEVRFPRGNAKLPLFTGELRAKFLDCASGAGLDAEALFDRLARLETLRDLREVAPAVAPA